MGGRYMNGMIKAFSRAKIAFAVAGLFFVRQVRQDRKEVFKSNRR